MAQAYEVDRKEQKSKSEVEPDGHGEANPRPQAIPNELPSIVLQSSSPNPPTREGVGKNRVDIGIESPIASS